MAGRAHTGKNVSEVLAFFYKMNESFARGLPAIQALTGSPVARGVTSDPHPADHPSPWTLAPGRGAGQKPRSAVGKGLRPHHTLMVIPGEYTAERRGGGARGPAQFRPRLGPAPGGKGEQGGVDVGWKGTRC